MRFLVLPFLFASTSSWAAIPKRFYGSFSGFESRAVYRGAAPDQAEIQIEIGKTGLTVISAEDEAGRRWRFHYAQDWIHPLDPQMGIRCFALKKVRWDETVLRICFSTFLINDGLPTVVLNSGSEMNDPIAQLYPHSRILGGQPFHQMRELFAQMKRRGGGYAAPTQPLNRDLLLSFWDKGNLEIRQKVLRVALRKIDKRKGVDQIVALDFARLGLNSGSPILQKQTLEMLRGKPRVSQLSGILSDLLEHPQILDREVLNRAVMLAISVAGEARSITEARAHMQAFNGSEALDEVFALRLGVIDANSVPHLMSLLNFGDQLWSAEQRVTLLTTLYRLSNDPRLPQNLRSDSGKAYVTDLAFSQPYIGKLCAEVLHGNKDEYQSMSGSESIIERAQ